MPIACWINSYIVLKKTNVVNVSNYVTGFICGLNVNYVNW